LMQGSRVGSLLVGIHSSTVRPVVHHVCRSCSRNCCIFSAWEVEDLEGDKRNRVGARWKCSSFVEFQGDLCCLRLVGEVMESWKTSS
jgi:hypothetical protein